MPYSSNSFRILFEVITNLKYWGGSEQIISKTLQLLSDLSVGYGTVRKLVKLEEVGFLLSHHTAGEEGRKEEAWKGPFSYAASCGITSTISPI